MVYTFWWGIAQEPVSMVPVDQASQTAGLLWDAVPGCRGGEGGEWVHGGVCGVRRLWSSKVKARLSLGERSTVPLCGGVPSGEEAPSGESSRT